MKPMSTQTLILIIWGSALGVGVLILGIVMHWMEPVLVYGPIGALFAAGVAAVTIRISKAIETVKVEAAQAKSEVAIERARSQMPPGLEGAKIIPRAFVVPDPAAYRARMPTLDDMSERAPDAPATPTETPVTVDVKS